MTLTLTFPLYIPAFVGTYLDNIYTDPHTHRERSLWDFFSSYNTIDIYRRFKIGVYFGAIAISAIPYNSYFSTQYYLRLPCASDAIVLSSCNLILSLMSGMFFAIPYSIPFAIHTSSILGIGSAMGLLVFAIRKRYV